MKKYCFVKLFSSLRLIILIIFLSVSFTGCSGCSSSSNNKAEPVPDPVENKRSVSGDVFSDTAVENAKIFLYDANGEAVNQESSKKRESLADNEIKTDRDGVFTITFDNNLYQAPFLLTAQKDNLFFASFLDENQSHINVSIFTTSVVIEFVRGLNNFKELMNDPGSIIKSLGADFSSERFKSIAKENKNRNAIFSDDEIEKMVYGSREEAEALIADILSWLEMVKTYMDHTLVTGTISGVVKAQLSNTPVAGVAISSHEVYSFAVSDSDGVFVLENVPSNKRIPVNFNIYGYTSNQEIVRIDSEGTSDKRHVSLEKYLKPVSTVKKLSIAALKEENSKAAGMSNTCSAVTFSSADGAIKIDFPPVAPEFRPARRSLADENTEITFEMTSIDPTSEREIFPGDFSAKDSQREALDDDGGEDVTLESVVLADISLYDENGNMLQPVDLGIDSVAVRMRIPDNLQDTYKKEYEMGVRTIPWWSFDETRGVWIREGDVTLIMIDGILYGTGQATHFSWWNIDLPISTHAVICGYVKNNSGLPVSGAQVTANGVDYQGNSYATTEEDGFYQLKVKRFAKIRLSASFGDISADYSGGLIDTSWDKTEYCSSDNRDTCCGEGEEWRKDISLKIIRISGKVLTPEDSPLEGARVKSSNGAVSYTDETGNYLLKARPGTEIDITASYILHGIKSSVKENNLKVLNEDITGVDFELSVEPATISGSVLYKNTEGVESPMKDVLVAADNGQTVKTDKDGLYTIYAQKDSSEIYIQYKALMPSGIYSEQNKTVSLGGNLSLTMPDIVFVEADAWLTGTVHDYNDEPFSGISVVSSYGKAAVTGDEGTFKIRVPVNSEASVTASYINAQLDMALSVMSSTFVIPAEGGTFRAGTLKINNQPAAINGRVTSDGSNLQNVKVFSQYGATDTTDENGLYSITAPVNRDNVEVTFIYESFDEDGNKRRWAAPVTGTIDTGNPGSVATLDKALEITSHPPVITAASATPSSVMPEETVTLSASAIDPDGDALTYQWYKGTELISETEETDYTFSADAEATAHEFKVLVSDGTNTVSRKLQVSVHENTAPVIYETLITPEYAGANTNVKAVVKAYDLEGDTLSFAWAWSGNSLAGIDLSGSGSEITFTVPDNAVAGSYTLIVTVSDNSHDVDTELTFEVLENREPVIETVSATPSTVKPGGIVRFTIAAADPDGDTITYSWTNQNDTELSTAASFNWTAPADITEETDIKITAMVSDGKKEVFQSVYVRVEPLIPNRPPVIAAVTANPSTIAPGDIITFGVSASDPDGDTVTYSWFDENGSELSQAASFSWTAPADITEETEYKMTIRVSDGEYSVSDETGIWVIPGTVPSEGVVSGHIRDENGVGIEGVAIRIYSAEDNGQRLSVYASTDADGFYRFENITAGSYYIVVAREGYVPQTSLFTVD